MKTGFASVFAVRVAALAATFNCVTPAAEAQFWNPWGQGQGQSFWGQPQPRQQYVPREYVPRVRPVRPRPTVRQQPATRAPTPAVAKPETPGTGTAAPEQPAVEGPPPPYEPQLLRLSEILGALSYLRDICGARDGDAWRAKMASLLDAEAKTQTRRERLAGAFNRGFRGYEVIYRTCTPNAETVIGRYLTEGERIARDISYRYGAS